MPTFYGEILVKIIETETEISVSFPYDEKFIHKAKSLFPYRWEKNSKTWCYPIGIREDVYGVFDLPCPPKRNKANFLINEELPSFLLSHQKKGLEIAMRNPKFAYYFSMGTGKTILAGAILKYKGEKALIVAPLSTLKTVWEETLDKFFPELEYINLYDFKKVDRERVILKNNKIHIANYETLKIHYDTILSAGYKCLIIDESSKLKGRTTQIAKAIVSLSQKAESVYLLSGTPAPNSKLEYYPQMQAVAPHFFGYNFYSFRSRYFHQIDRNGYKWDENVSTRQEFVDRLKKVSWAIKKEDIMDLPESIDEVRSVEMSPEQKAIYKQMKDEFIAEIKDATVVTTTVLSKISKLRQIVSGFVYHEGGAMRFAESKLNVLKEVLDEIGDSQVIIFGIFKDEIELLSKNIPNSTIVYGELPQNEKDNNIRDFKEGKFQYLIANQKTISHGQNLTNANYMIFYSIDWSAEIYEQARDRIRRYGQRNSCTYIHLLAEKTIDEIIHKRLRGKIEGTKEILEHLRNYE